MDDLSDMTLEKFKLWSIHALKVFLSRRNKSVKGAFEELAARAFCAWEEKLPVDEKAEQVELRLLREYKAKLKIDGDVVPDPFSLSGWKGEKCGMKMWPSIYITDITVYLGCATPQDVIHRLLNEYKEGKAYRYFDSQWVKEVFFHEIRPNSDKCILKAKVTPSQSINQSCYDVWIVVRKDSDKGPGGEILSGYCTCTAGMLGTCNHIAGVLFRIEYAVKTGECKKSCTSMLSQWNVPKGKIQMKPVQACDVIWRKAQYTKNSRDIVKEKEKQKMKQQFTPLTKKQKEEVKNTVDIRNKLYGLLKDDIGDSCFALLHEKRRLKAPTLEVPDSLINIAQTMDNTGNKEDFLKQIKLTTDQSEVLKRATKQQSASKIWTEQRKGRVTASVFQRINSRVDTLRKNTNADPSALVGTVMGTKLTTTTTAMKHGISLEPHAKKQYTQIMKTHHHKFKTENSGLSVYTDKPWIAASADLEVECSCCGKGLCEIKCPESVKDTKPDQENVKYLKLENGELTVDKNHAYYFQIQGQMKILDRKYCDLFVYTYHGHQCVRVNFDSDFWERLEEKLTWFWTTFVLPELLNVKVREHESSKSKCVKEHDINAESIQGPSKVDLPAQGPSINVCTSVQGSNVHTTPQGSNVRRALKPISSNKKTLRETQLKKRRRISKIPIYLCGTCGCDCLDEPQTEIDQSVNCDVCGVWVHYICAGVTDQSLENIDKWTCNKCE